MAADNAHTVASVHGGSDMSPVAAGRTGITPVNNSPQSVGGVVPVGGTIETSEDDQCWSRDPYRCQSARKEASAYCEQHDAEANERIKELRGK